MKKIVYISLALIAFGAASCKKEYTCDCVYTSTSTYEDAQGNDLMDPQTSTSTASSKGKDKEDDAKTKCEGSNGDAVSTANSGGIYVKQVVHTECKLK